MLTLPKRLGVFPVALLFVLLSNVSPFARAELVIKGGTLIDGTGKSPIPDAVIVIEGKVIKSVGKASEVTFPANATVIDASGKFVLPGLIDMHAHLGDWVQEIFLRHGVTTVLDVGNFTEWVYAQKEGAEKGLIRGPRIFAAGAKLDGYPPVAPTRSEYGIFNIGGRIYGSIGLRFPEEARKVVRDRVNEGSVDSFKVYTTITPDLLKAVVQEAHKYGVRVAGDLKNTTVGEAIGPDWAIDCIVHASNMAISMIQDPARLKTFRELQEPRLSYSAIDPWYFISSAEMESFIALLVRRNVYINPTIYSPWKGATGREKEFDGYILEHFLDPKLSYIPLAGGRIPYVERWTLGWADKYQRLNAKEKEKVALSYKSFQKFLRSFVQAGGKLLAGADSVSSGVPGYGVHMEMALLADAGLTPMQAIMAVTKWPAEYLNKIDALGTVEAGKLGDVIILKKNPLEDISNSVSIETVIKDGQVMDTSYHPDYRNPIPKPPEIVTETTGTGRSVPFSSAEDTSLRLSPSVIPARSGDVKITVTGKYFFEDTLIYFKDTPLITKYVNRESMEATIPGRMVESPGLLPIRVKLPGPRGDFSIPLWLLVKFP